jgi:hypothetical protein
MDLAPGTQVVKDKTDCWVTADGGYEPIPVGGWMSAVTGPPRPSALPSWWPTIVFAAQLAALVGLLLVLIGVWVWLRRRRISASKSR